MQKQIGRSRKSAQRWYAFVAGWACSNERLSQLEAERTRFCKGCFAADPHRSIARAEDHWKLIPLAGDGPLQKHEVFSA
ncbi:hypothetical protein D6851_14860 [Altericroceibacterium spongiae]|uniref:Uncharacterized protein n=1 Tax=Altericroceibacterium spongiae TaxID=2320269 RepID=A0A420EC67_9SPHN|nr:hypothetical protein D6851_14860 [Altericroceibacterium spongiae]